MRSAATVRPRQAGPYPAGGPPGSDECPGADVRLDPQGPAPGHDADPDPPDDDLQPDDDPVPDDDRPAAPAPRPIPVHRLE